VSEEYTIEVEGGGLIGSPGPRGPVPAHEWGGADGFSLHFRLPDGEWGPWQPLRGPGGPQGYGWAPAIAAEADGERIVMRIIGWLGGSGDPPAGGLGYVGPTGIVATAAAAVDFRGAGGTVAVPTSRTITGGGLAAGGGDLTANRSITVPKSSSAQAAAGLDDTTAMTPARTADAIGAHRAAAKAWVRFNGTGTVAITRAHNVSSITDNGTGDYTVNFASPLPTADYAVFAGGNGDGGSVQSMVTNTSSPPTTASVRLFAVGSPNGVVVKNDLARACVAVFH
jgi:hypothetical protein